MPAGLRGAVAGSCGGVVGSAPARINVDSGLAGQCGSCGGVARSVPARINVDPGSSALCGSCGGVVARVSLFWDGSHHRASTLCPGHVACRPTRRVLRDGALTRQDARSTADRSLARRPSTAPSRAPQGSGAHPTQDPDASRAPPHRDDLGDGHVHTGGRFTVGASATMLDRVAPRTTPAPQKSAPRRLGPCVKSGSGAAPGSARDLGALRCARRPSASRSRRAATKWVV
jgi:hypothetical protein